MTRKKRYLTITVLGILIASNLFNAVVPRIGEWYHFESESENFTFGAVPSKGRDVEMMERRYEYFLHSKGLEREEIYQIVHIELHKFWKWHEIVIPRRCFENYRKKYKIVI